MDTTTNDSTHLYAAANAAYAAGDNELGKRLWAEGQLARLGPPRSPDQKAADDRAAAYALRATYDPALAEAQSHEYEPTEVA